MTRGELVSMVAAKLGMREAEETVFIQGWANAGVVDVLLKTHAFIQIGEMDLLPGISDYRLDPDVLAIDDGLSTTPAGVGPYTVVTLAEMIEYQSANPVGSGMRKMIAIQSDFLIVAPIPESSELLKFYYVPRPDPMTADANDPSDSTYGGISTEYHRAIEYYMLWQGSEYDDKIIAVTAEKYLAAYENECKQIRKRLRRKAGRGLRGGRVGYAPRFRTGRNDVYFSGQ
jgi:hypothetical protein